VTTAAPAPAPRRRAASRPPTLGPGHRVVVRALGADPLDALAHHVELEPMAPPDPAELGADDVVIAVRAAAVGWVDLIMMSGQYQHVAEPPYTPGLEYAGVVAWVGASAAARHAVGDAVVVDPFLTGPRSSGPYQRWGGFASYAVAPAPAVRPIPGDLSFDQAAGILGSYETAYHCLLTRGRLAAGETVLILGASGATGLAAVQIAKRVGARVIAVGRAGPKLDTVRTLGADDVVAAERDAAGGLRPFREQVRALTGGRGVDVVYDGVGGELSLEALRCVRFGARFLIVGWASTPGVAAGRGQRGAPNANQLPTNLIMMKGLDVLGCPTVIATSNDPGLRPPRLAQIEAWLGAGELVPYVSHQFALSDYQQALRAKWNGEVVGGGVVRP
jgi:NADPH2:quinone reductase